MAVKIRLRRVGAKKQPSYRVVVTDARSPRDGDFIETIGHYNPLTDPETVKLNTDKARQWLQRGAQPTEAVARLLFNAGVIAKAPYSQPAVSEAAKAKDANQAEE